MEGEEEEEEGRERHANTLPGSIAWKTTPRTKRRRRRRTFGGVAPARSLVQARLAIMQSPLSQGT